MKILIGLALLCAPVFPAFAQAPAQQAAIDPATLQKARELVSLIKMERTFDQLFAQLVPIMSQAVIGMMQKDPLSKEYVNHIIQHGQGGQDRLVAIMSQEFITSIKQRYPTMLEEAAQEYARAFTAEELNKIVDFYSSPAGAKALPVMPELQQNLAKSFEKIGEQVGQEAGKRAFDRAEREMLPPSSKPAT